jgi:hypothetical protein
MKAILRYIKKWTLRCKKNAIEVYNCFELYNKNVDSYAVATVFVPEL